jgi:YD repeat-containing protein
VLNLEGRKMKHLSQLRVYSAVFVSLWIAVSLSVLDKTYADSRPEGYLRTPKCGHFGPTEELMSNPGVIWTFMAGGSASHILYPYVAGCTPREWRAVNPTGDSGYSDIQGFFFNEEGKSFGGYWKRTQTIDGKVMAAFNSVNFMEYNPQGYVTLHSYRCDRPGTDAWEVMIHDFDNQGRQVRQDFNRPAGCFAPRSYDPPMVFNWTYSYENKKFPQLPSRVVMEFTTTTTSRGAFDIEYITDDAGRIIKVRRIYSADRVEEDTYTYSEQGKIIKAFRTGRGTSKPVQWEYTYDGAGRLQTVNRDDGFQFKFTYRPDGQMEELVAPTPHYNPDIHKDRKNMTFKAIYNSDIKQPMIK